MWPMKKPHIVTVVGARPQFVKAAATSRALSAAGAIRETIIHTGQHYDASLSDVFFDELEIPRPALNLGVGAAPHGAMTGRIMEALEAYLLGDRPDAVLVFGDTNSTLAGALAAVKLDIPVVHIEAGMRSGRRSAPEEINRIVVDHVSSLLLCSTRQSVMNLEREGLAPRARAIGDVMYDVTLYAREKAMRVSRIAERLGVEPGRFDILTMHRAENTDDPARLRELVGYAEAAAAVRPVVFPVHPRTREALRVVGLTAGSIITVEPLGYFDFHRLLAECACVHTDSGGVQKEAYFHRKPCVTLRGETEWTETIEAGWNRLWTVPAWREPRRDIPDFGEGNAAVLAAAEIAAFLTAN